MLNGNTGGSGGVVSSRPRTTRRAPHVYPGISGDGFQYHSSQLTFSDEWYCPQTCSPEDVGSTPGLSHSHRRVLTGGNHRLPNIDCNIQRGEIQMFSAKNRME